MLLEMLALLVVAQQPPAGPPSSLGPRVDVIRRTGDGIALGAAGATDANQIEAAKLASTKASTAAVRSYATTVLHDHQRSLTAGTALAKRLHITRQLPTDSAIARGHASEMAQLNVLTGNDFDKAYVRFTVEGHQAAMAANSRAVAQATDPRVKAYLRQQPSEFAAHQRAGEAWMAAHP